MRKNTILILLLVIAVLIIGCTRNYGPTGYAANPQQAPQQNPYQGYYGGGCGVAPSDVMDSPVENLEDSTANL